MKYLSVADGWESVHQWSNSVQDSGLRRLTEDALRKALNLNKDFAHGDMRSSNIMARRGETTFEIKFVDFDWGGVVSSMFYPSFINTEEKWHEGVEPEMALSQAHDLW
ncbi:hypothetical protein L7F22_027677 [Adiantum nelumboides]|nr:hypothetical protein [Adiantum nelumboides]